jgi:hypothetical protein
LPDDKPEPAADILPGDIIQVTDQAHGWHTALLIVEGVRHWGVQAYTLQITPDGVGQGYNRLKHGQFEKVGTARLVEKEVASARRDAEQTAREVARDKAAGR